MKINVRIKNLPRPIAINLKAQKNLKGDLYIYDHDDMDIVLMPGEMKVLSFYRKDKGSNEDTYDAQDRLFQLLTKKGVIDPSTIRGGNVYGSYEASIYESSEENVDSIEATLFLISRFINQEKETNQIWDKYEEETDDWYSDPSQDDSTELGEIPHKKKQGSLAKFWPHYRTFYGYYFQDE